MYDRNWPQSLSNELSIRIYLTFVSVYYSVALEFLSLIRDKKELRYSFRANGFIVRDLNLNSADAAKRKLWLFQKIALEDIGSAIKQYRLEAKKKRTSPIWLY